MLISSISAAKLIIREQNDKFNLVFLSLIRNFAPCYDSMYRRETECGTRYCPHHLSNVEPRRLYGGQRIPGNMDLWSFVYAEGAPRLHPHVAFVESDVITHDTRALWH